jgi:predicted nucleic acid-binding protein
MSVWWATEVECVSAIARQLRHATVELEDANEGYARLEWLAAQWSVIEPSRSIRQHAISLLQTHDLRAADALQLAAAFVAAEGSPSTLEFVCLDDRLTDAARAEGFGIAIDNRG